MYLIVIATVGWVPDVVLAGLGEYGIQVAFGQLTKAAVAVVEEASKLIVPMVARIIGPS